MKSVKQIKNILELDTIHQVRNRVKAIQDIIEDYIKRGENNEILVSDSGVKLLKRLQELYESGLLLNEAANVLRTEYESNRKNGDNTDPYKSEINQLEESKSAALKVMHDELKYLRKIVMDDEKRKEEERSSYEYGDLDKWWIDWV